MSEFICISLFVQFAATVISAASFFFFLVVVFYSVLANSDRAIYLDQLTLDYNGLFKFTLKKSSKWRQPIHSPSPAFHGEWALR